LKGFERRIVQLAGLVLVAHEDSGFPGMSAELIVPVAFKTASRRFPAGLSAAPAGASTENHTTRLIYARVRKNVGIACHTVQSRKVGTGTNACFP
jgi:hypothetical protein